VQHSRSTSFPTRRGSGWINLRPASSVLGNDIIPDYVVNFIRGETPESLARRRERDGNPHTPEAHHNHKESSHMADLFPSHSRTASGARDLEDMLGSRRRNSGVLGKFMNGWRGGVLMNMSLGLVILLAAVVCVVLAVTRKKLSGEPAIIADGDCRRVSAINLAVHVVVNVLALFFLAGGNYVAQVLASPTRTEVAAAHENLRWLDIGIPSIRNLGGISKARALLSAVVVAITVGTQVIYNSILFTETSTDDSTCALLLNGPLLGAVGVLNLLFVLALIVALAWPSSENPLVTVGDAIVSFLMEPDHTTEGACLITKADVCSGNWACGEARYWFTESHRWVQALSKMRWLGWFITWLLPSGMAAAMLGMAVVDGGQNAFSSFTQPTSTYPLPSGIPRVGQTVIVALPHLLLVILYFSTNALMSVFYLSHEFSQFAVPGAHAQVRISSGQPTGAQTTSLYLTLPRPLSWLLFILFVAMGFMLSQSFHLVSIDDTPFLCTNPLPLVILLGLLAITAFVVAGLSLRHADVPGAGEDGRRAGNPLALKGGSCSAVISARCHRSAQEGADMASLPLTWGVVHDGSGVKGKVGHAAFSSQHVEPLRVGKAYA